MQNKVWIELVYPRTDEEGDQRCALANNMLAKLGITERKFCWNGGQGFYEYGDIDGGHEGLANNGRWFNLDFLGK